MLVSRILPMPGAQLADALRRVQRTRSGLSRPGSGW